MTKSVAILQSSYIPWKGYFDLVRKVDCFIFYDDVDYSKNSWRNRNKIKTPHGMKWLSIPCGRNYQTPINQVRVDNTPWQEKHFNTLKENYAAAPFWQLYSPFLEEVYLHTQWDYLSVLNQSLTKRICREFLHIDTEFDNSANYSLTTRKEERVLDLLEQCGATHYLSGPSAKNYLHRDNFDARGIALEYMDYSGYPQYEQLHPPFEHAVTILDLLLHCGPDAVKYLQPQVDQ